MAIGDAMRIGPVVLLPERLTQTIRRCFGVDFDRFNALMPRRNSGRFGNAIYGRVYECGRETYLLVSFNQLQNLPSKKVPARPTHQLVGAVDLAKIRAIWLHAATNRLRATAKRLLTTASPLICYIHITDGTA